MGFGDYSDEQRLWRCNCGERFDSYKNRTDHNGKCEHTRKTPRLYKQGIRDSSDMSVDGDPYYYQATEHQVREEHDRIFGCELSMNEYEKWLNSNAVVKTDDWLYPALGLAEESGEVLGNFKRVVREEGMRISTERRKKLLTELGDCLWYLTRLAAILNSSLEDVARMNMDKCMGRLSRGAALGEGDDR